MKAEKSTHWQRFGFSIHATKRKAKTGFAIDDPSVYFDKNRIQWESHIRTRYRERFCAFLHLKHPENAVKAIAQEILSGRVRSLSILIITVIVFFQGLCHRKG